MVPSAPDVRTVSEEEFPRWFRALRAGFLHSQEVSEEEIRVRRGGMIPERVLGAFEPDGRCTATFRTLPQRLTVPGGARVASLAVTNVTVLPTHRRRGLLTRMMRKALVEGKERGDACSTLDAAEYPIHGRYGYGPATWTTEWAVDAAHAGLDPRRSRPDEEGARIDLGDESASRLRELGSLVEERPGATALADVLLRTARRPWSPDEF